MRVSAAMLLACVLSFALLGLGTAARTSRRLLQSEPLQPYCQNMGPAANGTFYNATYTCLQFWDTGSPIQTPDDTDSIKYGQLWAVEGNAFAQFIDRTGKTYPIASSANPPQNNLELQRSWVLVLVKAELSQGTVTAFTPELYVPYTTVMSTMANTQFEGKLFNSPPRPAGANETSWFRWTFSSLITVTGGPTAKYGTFLHGTFDNLFHSVLDSQGNCRPALCADPTFQSAECKYYTEFFGNTTNTMTLNWDVNMHMADDTELVPMFPAKHRQYMAAFIELWRILNPHTFVPQRYTFFAHGTPMGIPQTFTGVFRAADTVVQYC